MSKSDPVVVIGAGPVGLCLALALAQQDVAVTLIESMSRREFPRSGAARRLQPPDHAGILRPHRALREDRTARHHRAQVPLLGPPGQRADRRIRPRAAQGRHALSLRAPVRAHQDHRGSAEDGEGASADRGADGHRIRRVRADAAMPCWSRSRTPPATTETIRGSYLVSAEGARSIARKRPERRIRGLHLSRAHDQHRGGLRFHAARLYRAQLHLRSGRILQPVPLEGPAGPLAHPLPDRHRRRRGRVEAPRGVAEAAASSSSASTAISKSAAAISTPCISAWREQIPRAAAWCWPATPRTSTARSAAWG